MARMGIDDTLHSLLGCIEAELEEAGVPVCTVGSTIGNPAIANCCECTPGVTGELWGNFLRLLRYAEEGYNNAPPRKPCAPVQWAAEYQVTLARCFPMLDEQGELPSAEERGGAAASMHTDVSVIHRALHCCTETEPPYLAEVNVTSDPEGGCSYLVAIVRVPVSLHPSKNGVAQDAPTP